MDKITVEYVDHMGDLDRVADFARTSFGKSAAEYKGTQNEKLVKYLAEHNHQSPFFALQLTLKIRMPLYVHAQAVKHVVGGSWNTISRRYVREDMHFYTPDWRAAPEGSIKQGSADSIELTPELEQLVWQNRKDALDLYNRLLSAGVAPELARGELPQALMTSCMANGSIAFWARIYNQRSTSGAQREWDTITKEIDRISSDKFPGVWEYLKV